MKKYGKYILIGFGIGFAVIATIGIVSVIGLCIYIIGPDLVLGIIDDLFAAIGALVVFIGSLVAGVSSLLTIITGIFTGFECGTITDDCGNNFSYNLNTYESEGLGITKIGTIFSETGETSSVYINSAANK